MAFCKEFNAATQKQAGDILPVVITVYKDKSFTFITKSPPASVLLKKAANIASRLQGAEQDQKVAKLTKKQVADIAKIKMKDLNARSESRRIQASSPAPPARWASTWKPDQGHAAASALLVPGWRVGPAHYDLQIRDAFRGGIGHALFEVLGNIRSLLTSIIDAVTLNL